MHFDDLRFKRSVPVLRRLDGTIALGASERLLRPEVVAVAAAVVGRSLTRSLSEGSRSPEDYRTGVSARGGPPNSVDTDSGWIMLRHLPGRHQ